MIPLIRYAYPILEKYKDMGKPISVISNQKFNHYLKGIGKLAGIDETVEIVRHKEATRVVYLHPKHELISAHMSRKTFATLSLEYLPKPYGNYREFRLQKLPTVYKCNRGKETNRNGESLESP